MGSKKNKNESLSKQVYILSVDSGAFFTDEEKELFDEQMEWKHFVENYGEQLIEDKKSRSDYEKAEKKFNKIDNPTDEDKETLSSLEKTYHDKNKRYFNFIDELDKTFKFGTSVIKWRIFINRQEKEAKKRLIKKLGEFEGVRKLRHDAVYNKKNKMRLSNKVADFVGILTRLLGLEDNKFTHKLLIVKNYYSDVMDQILENGFDWNDKHYIYLSSGSGQIKDHKMVCIEKSAYEDIKKALTCDLTIDEINAHGGVNPNKYNSYLSLSASASAPWDDFPIDDVLVVPDYSTKVTDTFDFIDKEEKEREVKDKKTGKETITKYLQLSENIQHEDNRTVSIDSFDGFGLIDPKAAKGISDIFIFRAPWCKGLLASVPFMDYFESQLEAKSGHLIIKDAWGDDYDLITNYPKIIMTDSQFKMRKYYKSLEDFKTKFKNSVCLAGINSMNDIRSGVNLNYQFLQTLDLGKKELNSLMRNLKDDLKKINVGEKDKILKILGANRELDEIKDNHIKAVKLYENLLRDPYCRELVKNNKKAMIDHAKGGRFTINGFHSVFILPDVVNFMSRIIGKCEYAIRKNEVVFSKIKPGNKVDVLRSPHLYCEHGIQTVGRVENKYKDYFKADGLYVSSLSSLSLLLMFDEDGDHVSVTTNKTLIRAAEKQIREKKICPLYYEMFSSEPQIIDDKNKVIGENLKIAYQQNIGIISNAISKILNSDNPDWDKVRLLTAKNNFTIDFCKSLKQIELPEFVKSCLNNKIKLPHFFIYAKGKTENQVNDTNKSTVNLIEGILDEDDEINRNIAFKNCVPMHDYHMLVSADRRATANTVEAINTIKEVYDAANKRKLKSMPTDGEDHNSKAVCQQLKNDLAEIENKKGEIVSDDFVCDVLVKYLYFEKKSKSKDSLWKMYGDRIVNNIQNNIQKEADEMELVEA